MSTNIVDIQYVFLNVEMKARDIIRLIEDESKNLCEGAFLWDLEKPALKKLMEGAPDACIPISTLSWDGEGSGSRFEFYLNKILPLVIGRAGMIVTWEGGGHPSGYILEFGKVTKCRVSYTLTPEGQ